MRFRRSSAPAQRPSREQVEAALASLRPGAAAPAAELPSEHVSDVLSAALQRVAAAEVEASERLQAATQRLLAEQQELRRSLRPDAADADAADD